MSKIDCSITKNYLSEKARLTNNCKIRCEDCELSEWRNGMHLSCCNLERQYPERAVEILQKWSDENPVKTRLDDFTEKYPNYFREPKDDTPNVCCKYLGYIDKCPLTKCSKCWDMPL